VPVDPSQLPKLVMPGQMLGTISRPAACQTGLPAGLPVFAAAADKACEVIGSGSLDPTVGCLSYGTTATINVTHRRYIEPIPLLPVTAAHAIMLDSPGGLFYDGGISLWPVWPWKQRGCHAQRIAYQKLCHHRRYQYPF
jgi:sugar (pentulose or hexulose) kinase